jgi:hypothetical protein
VIINNIIKVIDISSTASALIGRSRDLVLGRCLLGFVRDRRVRDEMRKNNRRRCLGERRLPHRYVIPFAHQDTIRPVEVIVHGAYLVNKKQLTVLELKPL